MGEPMRLPWSPWYNWTIKLLSWIFNTASSNVCRWKDPEAFPFRVHFYTLLRIELDVSSCILGFNYFSPKYYSQKMLICLFLIIIIIIMFKRGLGVLPVSYCLFLFNIIYVFNPSHFQSLLPLLSIVKQLRRGHELQVFLDSRAVTQFTYWQTKIVLNVSGDIQLDMYFSTISVTI
jgi:hypothetical protein